MKSGGCFLLIFGLFWSGVTLTFDVMIGRTMWQRLDSRRFVPVPGQVTESTMVRSRGSKGGTTYKPRVAYTYEVDGRQLTGNSIRAGMEISGERKAADKLLREFPVGRAVTVFHDPADPERSMLKTGIGGDELFMALFITPFNCVMVGIWSVPLALLRRRFSPEAGGLKIRSERMQTRVCLASFPPLLAALMAAGGSAFVLIFVIAFTVGPSFQSAVAAWSVVAAAAIAAVLWRKQRLATGAEDLVIDSAARMLTLPATHGRPSGVPLPFNEVLSVVVEQVAKRGSKGGTTFVHTPIITRRDGSREVLAEWHDAGKADGFAAWLRRVLDLAPGPVSPGPS